MADYTLSAKATFDGSNFNKGVKGSAAALEGFRTKSAAVASAVGNIAAGVFSKAASAISASVDSAVSRVDTLNNFPKVMENLGYSFDDAAAASQKMSDRLSGLPTKLDDMTSGVQRLVPSVQNVGRATDIMLAFNDAVLAGAAPVEVQGAALEQFSQGVAKGRFELEEWRSICTAMPGQMDQMAKSMLGASAGQQDLYEALKNGNVSMQDFLDTLVRLDAEGGEGFASFQQQAEDGVAGIGTAMANAKNSVTKGVAGIIQALGVENIVGVIDGAKSRITEAFAAVADGIETFKGRIEMNGAAQSLSDAFSTLSQAASDLGGAIGGIVGAILGVPPGTDPAIAAADALKAALDAAKPVLDAVADAFSWLKDNASAAAPFVAAIAAGFLAFRVVQGVAGFVSAFSAALSGVSAAAAPPSAALGKIGGAATMSAPQIIALGGAIALVGAGVLLAAAGLSLLAFSAIQLAEAGPGAVLAMVGLVAAIAGLALGASAVGPALTAGAVGIGVFGAAVLMVGAGIALACAGMALLATQLPVISQHGASAAVGIAALGAGMLAFAPGAIVAGAGMLVLAAGLLAAGAASLVLGAGILLVGAGLTVAALGATLLASQLPTIAAHGAAAGAALAVLGAASLVASPGLAAAGIAAAAFGIGMAAAAVAVAAVAVAIVAASAAVMLFGTALMVAGAGCGVLSAFLPGIAASGAAAGASLAVLAAGMAALGAGAIVAGAGIAVLGAGVIVAAAGVTAFGVAVTVAAAGVTLMGAGMMVLATATMLLAAGVVVAASGITAMAAALPTVASSAPGAAAGIAAFAAAALAATAGLAAGTPALAAYAAAATTAAAGVTAAAAGTMMIGSGLMVVAVAAPAAASGLSALASAASAAAPVLAAAAPSLVAASAASAQAASGFATAAAAAVVLSAAFASSASAAESMASSFASASAAIASGMAAASAAVAAFSAMASASLSALVVEVQAAMVAFTREMSQQSTLAMQMFVLAVRSGSDRAVAVVSALPGRIRGALGNLSGMLVSSGRALMNGFAAGIRSGFAQAISAAQSGMAQLRAYFPFSPAKKGPFSGRGYTTYSGAALVGGLAEGMEDNAAAPLAAMEGIGRAVSESAWEHGYHAAVDYSDGLASGFEGSQQAAAGVADDADAELQRYIDDMIAGYRERSHEAKKASTELADALWGPFAQSIAAMEKARPELGGVYDSMKKLEAAGYTLDEYADRLDEVASGAAEADDEFSALRGSIGSTVAEMREWQSMYRLKDDLVNDMAVAESWGGSLSKLFAKTGVRYSKAFVDRIVEGGEDYREAVAQMADMSEQEVQKMVDCFDDLARAEREQEINQRSLYVNSLKYLDTTKPQDWLLDFRETCLDVKEAVYSDAGLSKAFEMAGYSIEQCASDIRGMDVTMDDFVSGVQGFVADVSNGFDQMTKHGKTSLDEWERNLRLNMAESKAYAENLQKVFAKIPESIDSEAFRKAVYEGGFDKWGQVVADMAGKSADQIADYVKLFNESVFEGQQSALEQFQALSPGDKVVESLIAGIEAGKGQIAESVGQALDEGVMLLAENSEALAAPVGQAISQAIASGTVAESASLAVSSLAAKMGEGFAANSEPLNAGVSAAMKSGIDAAGSFEAAFFDVGVMMSNGIASGISSRIDAIAAAAAAVVRRAIAAAKAEAAIASPSRVMRDQVGAMLPAGMAVGIERDGKYAVEAMEGVAAGVVGAAEGTALEFAPAGGYGFRLGAPVAGGYGKDSGYRHYDGDVYNITVRDDRDIDALQRAMNRNNDKKMRAEGLA